MKTKLLLLSTALLCGINAIDAQVSAYTFSQFPGSYSVSASPTAIGMPLQDDDVNSLSLPFTFTYNGTAFTNVNVATNGNISFSTISGTEYSPVSDNSTSELISVFGDDLLMATYVIGDLTANSNSITNCSSTIGYSVGDVIFDWNNDFSSNPVITAISGNTIVLNQTAINTVSSYDVFNTSAEINESVSGTAPNRVYTIEYKKMSRLGVPDEVLNFSIRLYETTNRIEFVYGTCIAGQGFVSEEVGLKGANNSDYNSRSVITGFNNWNTSLAATAITDVCDFDNTSFPVTGQIYQWTPVTCTVPVLAVMPSLSVSCDGEEINLTASGATTYTWVSGPSTAQYTVAPNVTTSYTVVGANGSCTAALVYTAVVAPTPSLIVNQPNATICAGQSTTISATGATSYSWNGVAGNSNFVFSGNATATIMVTGSNGTCTAKQSVEQAVNLCTGISQTEIAANSAIAAFPNPFGNIVNVKNTSAVNVIVSLSDAIGRVLYTGTLESAATEKIDTENLPQGVYLLTVKGDGINETKRIVKK